MTIELYHSPYSTCSQKVRLVLEEKNIEYVSHELSFRKEEQLTPEYLKINPNGVLPTLVHNGQPILDSSCIIEYLDETFESQPLSPDSPLERAQMRAWLRFIEEVPTAAVRIPSFEQIFLPTMRLVKTKKGFAKSTEKRTLRQGFYASMDNGKGFSQEKINDSIHKLKETTKRMTQALKAGDWLMGDNISLVDYCVLPTIDRIADLNMSYLWDDEPEVQDWYQRITDRPAFKKAFYKGSRLSQRLEFKLAYATTKKKHQQYRLALETI